MDPEQSETEGASYQNMATIKNWSQENKWTEKRGGTLG